MAQSLLVLVLQWLELEQRGSIVLTLFITVFCLFMLRKGVVSWFSPTKSTNLPPSPPAIPIIGHLHQLGKLPHRSLRKLSQNYGPLMLLHLGQFPTLIVSSAEMAKEIMKNQDVIFANRPEMTVTKALSYGCLDIGFAPYGEYWRQVRKLCVHELLSIKRTQSFKFVREEEVEVSMEKISRSCSRGEAVNLSEIVLTLTNNIITRCTLGAKYEGVHGNRLGELAREVIRLVGSFCFADFFPALGWMDNVTGLTRRIKRVSQELDSFFDQVINEHLHANSQDNQRKHKEDLVDVLLLALKDNTNLTRDSVKAILLDMFVAGSDTSATTIEWAMAELIKNPILMKKTQDEVRRMVGKKSMVHEDDINGMEYLKCVVKESLRLHAPVPTLGPRESMKSTKLEGFDIPPNTRVFVNAWAIQRDSKLWDNPEEFHPERFLNSPIDYMGQDFKFIPFGSGRRGCAGIFFGITVIELVLANLLYLFDWGLPGGASGDELDMTELLGITVNRKIPLHVVPTLHSAY